MNPETDPVGAVQRTTIDPERDVVELGMWVAPLKCEGCGSRVDTFYRWNSNDDARCTGCDSEWEIAPPTDK